MNYPAEDPPTSAPKKYGSIKTSNNPTTFAQWQTACAYAKYLYLQGSYETCILKCNELLKSQKVDILSTHQHKKLLIMPFKIHGVHSVFLNFYAGLCHETLAETRGPEHKDFHSQLDGAEQYLSTALKILPVPQSKSNATHVRQGSYEAFKRELALQQRSSTESSRPDTDPLSRGDSKSSRTTPSSLSNDGDANDDSCSSGTRGRYNRILLSLKPELETHINYIQTLRQDSSEVTSRSNSHAGNNTELQETLAKIAVKQRVADGRKRNWKRARFSLIPQASSRIADITENT